jgi:predicted  nucleic acid-binding Zn-ribbon protein
MSTKNDYEQTKEILTQLKLEEARLPSEIYQAAQSADPSELVRLKKRQADMPSELFAAEVMVLRTKIQALKAEQADANNRFDRARTNSKKVDDETAAAYRVLDEEKEQVKQKNLAALSAVYQIQNEMQRRGNEIRNLEAELKRLLEKAA